MSMIDTPGMAEYARFLDLTAYRQKLITSNLANIDTPGYRTRDILIPQEMDSMAADYFPDEPTHPFARQVRGLMERPDGNNVDLDRESLLLTEMQLQYKLGVEFLKGELKTINEAINDGKPV